MFKENMSKNESFDNADEDSENSKKWKIFSQSLYNKFSSYEIQKNVSKFYFENFDDWEEENESQEIKVSEENIERFLQKIEEYKVREQSYFSNVNFTRFQFEELNNILSLTLNQKISVKCTSSEILITGNFINLQNLPELNFNNNDSNNDPEFICQPETLKKSEFIKVFALDTIFFDKNIHQYNLIPFLEKPVSYVFFAPKWEIKGYYLQINLNGNNEVSNQLEFPGKSGGIFLGASEKIVNGRNLRITADGGSGSFGEKPVKGGYPGNITLLELNDEGKISEVYISNKSGKNDNEDVKDYRYFGAYDLDSKVTYRLFANSGEKAYYQSKSINPKNLEYNVDIDETDNQDSQQDQKNLTTELAKAVNQYKYYLRENMRTHFRNSSLIQFYHKIENNDEIKDLYNHMGFVDELNSLEDQYSNKLPARIDFIPYYASLLNRINEYAKNLGSDKIDDNHKKLLNYLYTATLTKKNILQENLGESFTIVNIAAYIKLLKRKLEYIRNLKELRNNDTILKIINDFRKDFERNTKDKIIKARQLIHHTVKVELESIGQKIDKDIISAVEEVKESQKNIRKDVEKFKKDKEELKTALKFRIFFGTVRLACVAMSFAGPIGAVGGVLAGTTVTVVESLAFDNPETQKKAWETIQKTANSELDSITKKINEFKEGKVFELNKIMDELLTEPKTYTDTFKQNVQNIKDRLNKVNKNELKLDDVNNLINELHKEVGKSNELLSLEVKGTKKQLALKTLKRYAQATKYALPGLEIYSRYKSDVGQLDVINEVIEKKELEVEKLKVFESIIHKDITPKLRNMIEEFKDITNTPLSKKSKFESLSKVALEVSKWNFQNTIRNMKLEMKKNFQDFKAEADLSDCFEKMEGAMTLFVNAYSQIQDFQEQQNLANYIANINSANAKKVVSISQEIDEIINDLEIKINSNVIFQRYQVAHEALRQFVFPFAQEYFKNLHPPEYFKAHGNITDSVNKIKTYVDEIMERLDKNATIKTDFKGLDRLDGNFDSRSSLKPPFFVWENEKYKNIISELLKGQTVTLNADIRKSQLKNEVIHFYKIALYFKSKNIESQSEINDILKSFLITLVHSGDSYYAFKDKIYRFTALNQTIIYSFEKDPYGEPSHKNDVYRIIKNDHLMLSPYTLWEAKIEVSSTDKAVIRDKFLKLERYKDEIDLQLEGNAHYLVRTGRDHINVDEYYKSFEVHYEDFPFEDSTKYLSSIEIDNLNVDEDYESRKAFKYAVREKRNYNSDSWFSLDNLPSFNFLPLAEASASENMNFICAKDIHFNSINNCKQCEKDKIKELNNLIKSNVNNIVVKSKEYVSQKNRMNDNLTVNQEIPSNVTDDTSFSFMNGIKTLKNIILSKLVQLNDFKNSIFYSDSFTTSSEISKLNNYSEYITKEQNLKTLNFSVINFEQNNYDFEKSKIEFDSYGNNNLILAQLIIGKKFGRNSTLGRCFYSSSEQEQNSKADELLSQVLSVSNHNSFYQNFHDFLYSYDNSSEWYQNMFKEEVNGIFNKRSYRKNEKQMLKNYAFDETLAESTELLGL